MSNKVRAKLILTQGLPASGKTTWALNYTAKNDNAVMITSDDVRQMMFNKRGYLGPEKEAVVKDIVVSRAALLLKRAHEVVICDTNLNPQTVRAWKRFAEFHQVPFHVESFMHVLPATCIQRDALRPRELQAGADRIKQMYDRWQQQNASNAKSR